MAEQIGNNGNELTLIIPSALEKDWAVSIRDNCFSVISSHDHSGSGAGKKLIAADAIDATSAWLANDTYLLFKDNAGTSTVDVIKATTSDELQFGTTIAVADFQSDGLTVSDATDNTKKLALDLSGITTATTRTLTIPDASDTIALISTAQTFTNKTIDADLNTISNIADAQIKSGAAIALNKLAALTASRAVVSDGSGVLSSSSVTSTELGYVSGVTSAIQTQLDSKQAASSNLDAIAAVATNGGLHRTGAGTYAARTLTGTTNEIDVANGDGVSGDPTVGLADNPVIPGTDSMVVPSGTIAQRVSTTDGSFRFNSELSRFEGYRNSAWSEIGGGAGGINYIDDNDAEAGVGDWATYADAAGENAVDGTGGAATLTFTQNATTALRGSNDFKFAKDAADRQGEGASYDFSIDNADKSQKLYIGFDYDASDANYADNDIRIAVYDVTNANLIRVNGEDLKGGKGKYLGWFQSAADSTSYRLIIHQSSMNATAYDIFFDNISVGPREVSFGSAMTDWKSYTPTFTGFGTVSSVQFEYRRVGSNLEVRGDVVSGSSTAVEAQMTLPDGLTIKNQTTTGTIVSGMMLRADSTTVTYTILSTDGDSFINFGRIGASDQTVPQLGNTLTTVGERFTLEFSVPIKGWSSNALMSEDIGNREVRVRGAGNAGESITADVTPIPFIEEDDTTASWDGSTFTAPESGSYAVSGMIYFTSSLNPAIEAFVDGTFVRRFAYDNTSATIQKFQGLIYLNKGEALTIRSSSTLTLSNSTTLHWIHIEKFSQPQTLLETETVAARYTSNSGASVTHTSNYIFEDIVKDTHNAYNPSTGVYTVPVSGWYLVNAQIGASSGKFITIEVNGTATTSGYLAASDASIVAVTALEYLNKDDTVEISNTTGVTITMASITDRNSFSIAKIK